MFRSRQRRILGIAMALAVAVWLSALVPRSRTLEVTFFDVGDGLCTVVRTPSGKTLVMDCGTSSWRNPSSVGGKLIAPYLQSLGVNTIDVAVLSHPHSDHISGFPDLLKAEPAQLVLDNCATSDSPEYAPFRRAIRRCHARHRDLHRGQTIDLGDGVTARVLSPASVDSYSDANDDSLVLRLSYGRVAMLLAADAAKEAEHDMLDSGMNLRAQVLQVGHHGSRDSTSPEWLSAVRPQIAVISCSSHSRYGFPSAEVLRRLQSVEARTYTTGRSGAVTVTTDGSSIRVSTFRSPQ